MSTGKYSINGWIPRKHALTWAGHQNTVLPKDCARQWTGIANGWRKIGNCRNLKWEADMPNNVLIGIAYMLIALVLFYYFVVRK